MTDPGRGNRHALIVATNNYEDPRFKALRAPSADAVRLAGVLGDPRIGDFKVTTVVDEEEHRLRRRIATFFHERGRDDLLLLHFSCHAVKDERNELYIVATDTNKDLLSATGLPARWLNDEMMRSRSGSQVLLLDCCFSGSFPHGLRARSDQQVNIRDHLENRGSAVISATSAIEYAFEGDDASGEGHPSVFTEAVVEGLESGKADRDGDLRVSISELYDYVFDRVKETTPDQTPTKSDRLEGQLFLARVPVDARGGSDRAGLQAGPRSLSLASAPRLRVFVTGLSLDAFALAVEIRDRLTSYLASPEIGGRSYEALGLGVPSDEAIDDILESCDLVLAIIGSDWHDQAPASASALLDRRRRELEGAIRQGTQVLVVLAPGAKMPAPAQLPREIVGLTSSPTFSLERDGGVTRLLKLIADKADGEA